MSASRCGERTPYRSSMSARSSVVIRDRPFSSRYSLLVLHPSRCAATSIDRPLPWRSRSISRIRRRPRTVGLYSTHPSHLAARVPRPAWAFPVLACNTSPQHFVVSDLPSSLHIVAGEPFLRPEAARHDDLYPAQHLRAARPLTGFFSPACRRFLAGKGRTQGGSSAHRRMARTWLAGLRL